MFKIGEFSKLTQVSIRMLRYYDETGLLKPAVTDHYTNYRLYSADQIAVLNKIIFLRDLGFHVQDIAAALHQWDDEYIVQQLDSKRHEIEHMIKEEQEKLLKIEQAKKDIRLEKIEIHYNVSIKSVPGVQVLSLRRVVPSYYSEGQLWKEMTDFAAKNKIYVSNNTFAIYHDSDYREKNVDIEICAPVPQMGKDKEGYTFRKVDPVPIMASTMVYGAFENISGVFRSFAGWLEEHSQYKMLGQSRQIVHRGPWNESNSDNYLTEIQIPLEKI